MRFASGLVPGRGFDFRFLIFDFRFDPRAARGDGEGGGRRGLDDNGSTFGAIDRSRGAIGG